VGAPAAPPETTASGTLLLLEAEPQPASIESLED
jgi:hypothetical protein